MFSSLSGQVTRHHGHRSLLGSVGRAGEREPTDDGSSRARFGAKRSDLCLAQPARPRGQKAWVLVWC
jgi:hypothetical protein